MQYIYYPPAALRFPCSVGTTSAVGSNPLPLDWALQRQVVAFVDFGPIFGSEPGEKNGGERVEIDGNRVDWRFVEVHKFPQESPRTRAFADNKVNKNTKLAGLKDVAESF